MTTTTSNEGPVYTEQCSCGAVVSFSGDRIPPTVWKHIKAWRLEHQHSDSGARVSTTAKGAFGFTRYVPEWEDREDSDDDDD